MKKISTLLFVLSISFPILKAQTCAPSAQFLDYSGSFKLTLNYDTEALADAIADQHGTGCTNSANCYGITSLSIQGTNVATGYVVNTTNMNQLKDIGGNSNLRLDGNNDPNAMAGAFQGTIEFGLTGGGTLVCTYDAGGALPVSIISFKAKAVEEAVMISWQTASEMNNDYMAVMRSTDGVHFEELGRVTGTGFSDAQTDYQMEDRQPAKGINYYRLRQVDFDGKETFSHIIQLAFKQETAFGRLSVYPTVVQNQEELTVDLTDFTDQNIQLDLFSLGGQLMATYRVSGGDKVALESGVLETGMYLIRLQSEQGVAIGKFSKI